MYQHLAQHAVLAKQALLCSLGCVTLGGQVLQVAVQCSVLLVNIPHMLLH